jgi:uncharacterized protein (DUF885 family)
VGDIILGMKLSNATRTTLALALAASLITQSCQNSEGKLVLPETITEYLPANLDVWPDSAGAIENKALVSIARDVWDFRMRTSPTWATYLGDPRFHGTLADNREVGSISRNKARRGFLVRIAGINERKLNEQDALTLALLQRSLSNAIATENMGLGAWNVSARGGPQVSFLTLASDQPVGTPKERAMMLQRWRRMGPFIRQASRNLINAMEGGNISSATAIEKVLAQLDNLLHTPSHLSPLMAPATAGGTWAQLRGGDNLAAFAAEQLGDALRAEELRRINLHLQDGLQLAKGAPVLLPASNDILPPEVRGRFVADVWEIIEDEVYPAFREYERTLRTEILPRCRPDGRPGLLYTPDGQENYKQRIESFTTLSSTAEEIHELGMSEVTRLRGEMVALGREVFGTTDLRALRAHMAADAALHYESREEIEAVARSAVRRMEADLSKAFSVVPTANVEVVPVPAHEEAFTTMAYYRGPTPDGSRPGRYYINTYEPTTKPRWEAEVLAFHEAVPGHHLQIALANELVGLPMIRSHGGIGAYVEGWALYTETLADEMGMYSSDVSRLGMFSFDAWRSCRLVVDTGIHAMGWSRDRAIRFLEENTLADIRNIENEVDRYISWPGQALGYKIGQLEIFALRAEAKEALGPLFDLRGFHQVVLGNGPVTLPLLRKQVEAWTESVLASKSDR